MILNCLQIRLFVQIIVNYVMKMLFASNDYVLFNSVCHNSIPHCISYATNSIELKCQTSDAEFKLISNICFQISKYQQLNVELVNDINSKFSIIQFYNNDILFIWMQDGQVKSQKFDQHGNQYSTTKNIIENEPFRYYTSFDICAFENNKFIIVFFSEFQKHIILEVYDYYETLLIRNEHYTSICLAFRQNFLQLKCLGNDYVAIFYEGSLSSNALQLQPSTQFYTETIDVEIFNNQIKVWLENDFKSEIRYFQKTFDFDGNLVKIVTKKNGDIQVEFKILTLFEVWTEIVYSKYEVYYVIKLNNKNQFEPKKLSISSELLNLIQRLTYQVIQSQQFGLIQT